MGPEDHVQALLDALGWTGDPELAHTPRRFVELLRELTPGDPPDLSAFEISDPGPVALRDLPFHSLCAHHLLPFFGTATIAYLPRRRVGGFSGIARLLQHHALRPQVQERLANDVADALVAALDPIGVRVRLEARQLCMEMRGARAAGTAVVVVERGDASRLREL